MKKYFLFALLSLLLLLSNVSHARETRTPIKHFIIIIIEENHSFNNLFGTYPFGWPPIILTPNNWSYPLPLQYPVHYGYIAKVPSYPSYAQVYPAPAISFLLPLDFLAFVFMVTGVKKKSLITASLILFLLALVISTYYYEIDNTYAFVSEYYTYSSLIGFLVSSVLYLRVRKRWIAQMGFVTSFVPSSFEGFEMAMFYSLARMKDRTRASWGALVGVLAVAVMLYLTYLVLPALISDTGEHLLKLLLGFTFLALATFFLYREDYPEPRTAFLAALVGMVAEGAEVDLFSI